MSTANSCIVLKFQCLPDKFAFLILERKLKLEELRGHKVIPVMSHTFDLLPPSIVQYGGRNPINRTQQWQHFSARKLLI